MSSRLMLLGGAGRAQHRVSGKQRFGKPLAHIDLAPRAGSTELIEAQVAQSLGQPRLENLDALDVGTLPPQERLLHRVLGFAGGTEHAV